MRISTLGGGAVDRLIDGDGPGAGAADASRGPDRRVLMTADELNVITGWGRGRIYEMMADGRLPVVRVGRRVRIHWPTLERWFEEQAAAFDEARLRDSLTAA